MRQGVKILAAIALLLLVSRGFAGGHDITPAALASLGAISSAVVQCFVEGVTESAIGYRAYHRY